MEGEEVNKSPRKRRTCNKKIT